LTLILSTYTSDLRSQISETEWESLGGGWARLILVMMWETEKGEHSKWGTYLSDSSSFLSHPKVIANELMSYREYADELRHTDVLVGRTAAAASGN
jgi:hypothetical protein